LAPASSPDAKVLDELVCHCRDQHLIGDKAYNDAELEERLWRKRRTKKNYAQFMKYVAETHYPDTEITLVAQDNLNTHNPSSLYEILSPEAAFALAGRFEMHYTPTKASWLNMVEIELSILAKQCLDRRIGNIENP
jgi:hypothetical protein